MNLDTQSVDQTVSAMADILANYLHPEEVRLLTTQWKRYTHVSVKMVQQCVLDTMRRYPELQAHKSEIRNGFWDTLLSDTQQESEDDSRDATNNEPPVVSQSVQAFYTVMDSIGSQLSPADRRNLFHIMHQVVSQERTFKGHNININQFLEHNRPPVPDDEPLLNSLVQLTYICLCDMAGPVDADEMLFRAAEMAKQHHPKAVVEKLF